jgi:hypothetical protein
MRRKFATTKNTSTIELAKRGVFRIKVGPVGDIKKRRSPIRFDCVPSVRMRMVIR